MRVARRLAAGLAALTMAAGATQAADLSPPVVPPPVVVAPAVVDWSGPYVGVFGGIFRPLQMTRAPVFPFLFDVGVQGGFNLVRGNFLVGVEGRLGVLFYSPLAPFASVSGRAGVLLGAEHKALLFAASGVGYIPGPGAFWSAGGGAEFALNDRISIFGEARLVGAFGFGPVGISVQAGVNLHLGH